MTVHVDTSQWSAGQRLALSQLQALERDDGLQILQAEHLTQLAWVQLHISLPTATIPAGPGLALRPRERFTLTVRSAHPLVVPMVSVAHRRWAGTAHVQWGGHLCLFAAPAVEWQPAEGMRCLIERLRWWLERAAAGTLDGEDLPVHPPVAYGNSSHGTVVIRADLASLARPSVEAAEPTFFVAMCEPHGERLDVVDWVTPANYAAAVTAGTAPDGPGAGLVAAAVVLLGDQISFEYPEQGKDLLAGLQAQDVAPGTLLTLMGLVAHGNVRTAAQRGIGPPDDGEPWPLGPGGSPLMVIVGTPSREPEPGDRRMHLVAWRADGLTGQISDLAGQCLEHDIPALDEIADRVHQLGEEHLADLKVMWARVLDDRAEVTRSRATGTAVCAWTGRRVLILGCGALGAPVAEMLVRAGAQLTVVDNGIVTPGILIRQPYDDSQLGQNKASALADRLRRVQHRASVAGRTSNALDVIGELDPHAFDLIIDATAHAAVRSALELRRVHTTPATPLPPVLTLLVGHTARRGVVTVSHAASSGGGLDVLRKLGIASRGERAAELRDVADDLFPLEPRDDPFVPEPGCSAPTFTGSQVEATTLAGMLLNAGLDALAGRVPSVRGMPMAAAAARLDHDPPQALTWVGWPDDLVLPSTDGQWQVRISPAVLATVRAEARDAARRFAPDVETGGMLLGALDESTAVIHLDVATAPTPDSRCSRVHFQHGTEGSQDVVDHYRQRTGRLVGFIGMWHTHPFGAAAPSPTDNAGMANLATPVIGGPPRALMLIAGGPTNWAVWMAGGTNRPDLHLQVVRRARPGTPIPPQPDPPPAATYFVFGDRRTSGESRPWWRRWIGAHE